MQKLGVELYPHENQYVQDAYDALITNLFACDPVTKSICVTSNAPSVGKTTISINLAISYVMTGRTALLIDTDIRKSNQYKRLSGDDLHGLSDFFGEYGETSLGLDDVTTKTNMRGLSIITSGTVQVRNPLGMFYSPKFERLLKEASEQYDLVIIDTSSLDVNADSSIITTKVDGTMLVVQLDDSAKALDRNIARLSSMGANIIITILNKLPKNEYKTYMEFYDYRHTGERRKRLRIFPTFPSKVSGN